MSSQKVTSDKTDKSSKSESRFTKFKQAPVCYNCKKPGHFMPDCYFLKKDKESQKTIVRLVNSKQSTLTTEDIAKCVTARAAGNVHILREFCGWHV